MDKKDTSASCKGKTADTILKCPDCGEEFVKRSSRHVRCLQCAEKRRRKLMADNYLKRKVIALAGIGRTGERRESVKSEKSARNNVLAHHCPFCGKMTIRAYCAKCHYDGFDEVHKMFGRTNGWDRRHDRQRDRHEAPVFGWRGSPVIGLQQVRR